MKMENKLGNGNSIIITEYYTLLENMKMENKLVHGDSMIIMENL
jgi:hypothetical protein